MNKYQSANLCLVDSSFSLARSFCHGVFSVPGAGAEAELEEKKSSGSGPAEGVTVSIGSSVSPAISIDYLLIYMNIH